MNFILFDRKPGSRKRIRTSGGYSCIVRNCSHKTTEKEYKFFRLPVRDPDRLSHWLKLCHRVDLNSKPEIALYQNYRICSKHFEKRMYSNPEDLLNRLLPSAIPTLHLPKGLGENDSISTSREESVGIMEEPKSVGDLKMKIATSSRRKGIY
ncbi:hypothetical protein HHI36_021733 [Cryptolaemus montrouzieri]|uniref:THAP-type domain-containing protein n=1 Tax=Cryptolaemus montrouzieri TaxID=559131 RepID=A0ABD2MXY6_9CUCU